MQVGYLGNSKSKLIFRVSTSQIKTLRDGKQSGSASISSHQRHIDTSLSEFVGLDAEQFTFNIRLSSYLGVSIENELETLRGFRDDGTIVKLVIGTKTYGRGKWLVKKLSETIEYTDASGNVTSVDVAVTLTEY